MKYALSLTFGLLLGVAVALGIIYFNPLTQQHAATSGRAQLELSYQFAGADNWLSTHSKSLKVPVIPSDVPLLWESGINGMMLAAMPLKGAAGSVVGTKISAPSAASEFLHSGVLVDDYWLLSVPGEGSIFVHSINNQWPLLRDTIVTVDWLGRSFSAATEYLPTVGPSAQGASVVGMTGAYRGAKGHAHESMSLDFYRGDFTPLSGRLAIDMSGIAGQGG